MKKSIIWNFLRKTQKSLRIFFSQCFAWEFIDYGPEYIAITGAGIDGGFYLSELNCSSEMGSVLVVLYSQDLKASEEKIIRHGGVISKETFSFPGGQRFHFKDPNGNEYAMWSEV